MSKPQLGALMLFCFNVGRIVGRNEARKARVMRPRPGKRGK